jgi:hypothetical protein
LHIPPLVILIVQCLSSSSISNLTDLRTLEQRANSLASHPQPSPYLTPFLDYDYGYCPVAIWFYVIQCNLIMSCQVGDVYIIPSLKLSPTEDPFGHANAKCFMKCYCSPSNKRPKRQHKTCEEERGDAELSTHPTPHNRVGAVTRTDSRGGNHRPPLGVCCHQI